MYRLCRFMSQSAPARDAAETVRILPTLAARQFPPKDASKNRIEALKRKENRLKRQIIRDVNNLKQHSIRNMQFQVDPVLGHADNQFVQRMKAEVADSSKLAHGYNKTEFEKLMYGAQKAALDSSIGGKLAADQIAAVEEKKRAAVLTILNMKNTNSADRKKLAVDFARREFERFEGDTGSPEVQAAVMTAKIHMGFDHVRKAPKDKSHIETIRQLVSQRQRILKYLKRDDPQKYFHTIAKLGLTDDVITSEFSMGMQYFQDYKVWGDKELVHLSEKQKRKEQKYLDLQKKVNEYTRVAKKNHSLLDE